MSREDVSAAKKELSSAKDALKQAKKEYNAAIAPIKEEISSLEDSLQGKIGSCGPCKVYGNRVEMGFNGSVELSPDIVAQVSVSGNTYTTTNVEGGGSSLAGGMGGAMVGGLLAGPLGAGVGAVTGSRKKVKAKTELHDNRKCFLSVSGAGGSCTCEIPINQEGRARQLAAQINALGKSYPERKARYDREMPPLKKRLEEAEANTGAMDEAQRLLEEAKTSKADAKSTFKAEKKEARAEKREVRQSARAEKKAAKAEAKEEKRAAKAEAKEEKKAEKAERKAVKEEARAGRGSFFHRG